MNTHQPAGTDMPDLKPFHKFAILLIAPIAFVTSSCSLTRATDRSVTEETVSVGRAVLGWIEIPEGPATGNAYVAYHMLPDGSGRNYSLLYDTDYRISYWVAYPLTVSHIGAVKRRDNWTYDPAIDKGLQPYLKKSYTDRNLDRGHQIPSKDRTYCTRANAATFYVTNSTPQNSILNQQGWAALEDKVRSWAFVCDTLYVVTGAVLPPESEITYTTDSRGDPVAVPAYYFKAVAQRHGECDFTTAAYRFDNAPASRNIDLDHYRLTVSQLKELTGYTFFPALPEEVKSSIDTRRWLDKTCRH